MNEGRIGPLSDSLCVCGDPIDQEGNPGRDGYCATCWAIYFGEYGNPADVTPEPPIGPLIDSPDWRQIAADLYAALGSIFDTTPGGWDRAWPDAPVQSAIDAYEYAADAEDARA